MMNKCEKKKCPECGETYVGFSALSRIDNETYVCPDCGLRQALNDFIKHRLEMLQRKVYGKTLERGDKIKLENGRTAEIHGFEGDSFQLKCDEQIFVMNLREFAELLVHEGKRKGVLP